MVLIVLTVLFVLCLPFLVLGNVYQRARKPRLFTDLVIFSYLFPMFSAFVTDGS